MSADFDAFWAAYPRRLGANPRSPARTSYDKALKRGAKPEELIEAVKRFAADPTAKVGTEFIPMASTWLNQRRWEDYSGGAATPVAGSVETPLHGAPCGSKVWIMEGSPEWEAWKWWNDGKLPPQSRYGGWAMPSRWPPDFEDTNTSTPGSVDLLVGISIQ